jgi:DNA-binding LytR/AlgR family response regulator
MMICVAIDDEPMALDVIAQHCADSDLVELKATFRDPLKAADYLRREKVDLIFLDINMPGISGMQLAESLSPAPMIIFTTAYSHYAVESYNVGAVDYLMKPIVFERFLVAINKAAKAAAIQNSTGNNEITVYLKSGPQTYPVRLGDILYLQKDGNYMTVHLKGKQILIRENMGGVFELVPAADFIRVHKSYVVAIKHITMIEAQQLRIGGIIIPVGSSYRESVRAKLGLK